MALPPEEISRNYRSVYAFVEQLLARRFRARGQSVDPDHPEVVELCQSVIGHPPVVELLCRQPFCPETFAPVVEQAIDAVRRALFPDVCKRRFVSLDVLNGNSSIPAAESPETEHSPAISQEREAPDAAPDWLSQETREYLRTRLLVHYPEMKRLLHRWLRQSGKNPSPAMQQQIEEKLKLFHRFYPEGKIPCTAHLDGLQDLSPEQVVQAYLNVYLGIEAAFPPNFLRRNARRRAAILVRFLIDEILQTTPEDVLRRKDKSFFLRHRLQNVYRLFNYSFNRALRNAYPDRIPPWLHSRTNSHYWENPRHRAEAIRWLVEHRLQLSPRELYRRAPNRDDFAACGLSYMFNRYYNSVSWALAEAYPELEPWERGKVPFDFWNEETGARAVRWLVEKKGWSVHELPEKARSGEFNRKTFSEFGLATLFEKKFSRNLYRAVSAAWPGYFQPWEFGRVSSEYWQDAQNVYEASRWIARQEGLAETEVVPAIRQKRLTWKVLQKYSIGSALRRWCRGKLEQIFAPAYLQDYAHFLEEHRLLRRISNLKKSLSLGSLIDFILYGFFYHDTRMAAREHQQRYDRIARRIRRRLVEESP